jgi:hypothetical protein
MLDEDCWHLYPRQRILFDKLWVSSMLGYLCGPGGVAIPLDGKYIVRPIYNLHGMSRGATSKELLVGDSSTPPGYFWCEFFKGEHYSVDFVNDNGNFKQILVVKGDRESEYKFTSWTKIPLTKIKFEVPNFVEYICKNNVEYLNIEYIDDKVIEVHMRRNPDFVHNKYSKLEVVWASSWNQEKYDREQETFFASIENVYNEKSEIIDTRLGFFGKILQAV